MRGYGWLAVALVAALSACSGGGGGGGAVVPPAQQQQQQQQQTAPAMDTVRQVECHVGSPSPAPTLDVCNGTTASIDGYADGNRDVPATSADSHIATVVRDKARNKSVPTENGHRTSWFDV